VKVKVSFTVDIDYEQWSENYKKAGKKPSPAAARGNIVALAEEGFEHAMVDYVDFEYV
jgi:hypothetical protein